jgi:chaperonin GroEL
LPLLAKVDESGVKQAIVIAEDFDEDCLANLVLNNVKGTFRTLAIPAPWYEHRQRAILDDIAIATGATVISNDTVGLSQASTEHFGKVEKAIATNLKTTLIGCAGEPKERIKQLKERLKSAEGADKEHLELRIAAIAGQVAIIRVGGQSETEIEERKFRVDDAVAATRAALDSGILPGGAVALYRTPVKEKTPGAKLLAKTLQAPFKQLMENSNIDVKQARGLLTDDFWQGINVRTGKAVDLKKEGIIDPYAVTAEALKTAVSLGIIGMTAGALVIDGE